MVGDWMGRMPIGLAVIRSAHRFLKADRKAGFVAAVSARALIVLKAILASFDQLGIRPHLSRESWRLPSTNRTAGTGAVGGML